MTVRLLVRILIVVVLVGGAVFGARYFLRPEAVAVVVRRGVAVDAVPGTVTVLAGRPVLLKSEFGGRIAHSVLAPAKRVAAGDVLVEVDSTTLKLEIEDTKSQIAARAARRELGSPRKFELENAQVTLENMRALLNQTVSQVDFDRQERAVRQIEQQIAFDEVSARRELEALENSLKTKEYQLEKMSLRSPVDGIVNQVFAYEDDLIGGGATVAEITPLDRVVEAKISEENFSGVRVGQQATVQFFQYGGLKHVATVGKILPAADPQTQRYVVYLDVQIPREELVPGITGDTSIVIGHHENALIIPRSALLGTRVFVVKDSRAELREVKVGFTSMTDVEIESGLQEGELVAVENLDLLRNGDRVRLQVRPGSVAASAPAPGST